MYDKIIGKEVHALMRLTGQDNSDICTGKQIKNTNSEHDFAVYSPFEGSLTIY